MDGGRRRNDRRLFTACIVIILILFTGFKLLGRDGAEAAVYVDGVEYGRYPLDKEARVDINGTNSLLIRGGRADMTGADCPDQLCVKQKAVSLRGETIVCLPNRVIVKIEGEAPEGDMDGVTY